MTHETENIKAGSSKTAGIIFDLDGTLIDSTRDLAASVNHALQQAGLPNRSVDEVREFIGDGVGKLIERAVGGGDPARLQPVLETFMSHYRKHCTDTTRLYKGTQETLQTLSRDYHLGVLTNKSLGFTETILTALGILPLFADVIGGDSLPVKKPDPAGILYLSDKWNIPGERLVMVGDHHTDIRAGMNGAIRTIFIDGRMGHADGLQPDATISSFIELPETIRSISTVMPQNIKQ